MRTCCVSCKLVLCMHFALPALQCIYTFAGMGLTSTDAAQRASHHVMASFCYWLLCWVSQHHMTLDADRPDGAQVDTTRVTIGGRQAFGCIAMPDFLSALAKAVKPNGAHSSAYGVAACRHGQEDSV